MKKFVLVLITLGVLAGLVFSGCGDGDNGGVGPSVVSTSPADGAVDVAVDTLISVSFDMDIDCSGAGLVLSGGEASTAACDGDTVTFTPSTQLAASTEYTATVSGVTNLAGDPTETGHTWSFTTGTTGDTVAPSLVSTTPASGATDVAVDTLITATYDEDIDCAGIVLTLSEGESSSVACNGPTATFTPDSQLSPATTYTAVISGVTDLAGNPTATNATWDFTTGQGGDTVGPSVIEASPTPGSPRVTVGTPVYVKFDEDIECSGASFSLSPQITGTSTCNGDTFNVSLDASFVPGTSYTATLSGVTDLAGNPMESSYEWAFTIELRISDIEFPDQNLENCISITGYTYPDEVLTLECAGRSISDLSGIEHFTGLRTLILGNNNISNLTPVSSLPLVNRLVLRENNISDLTPLSGMASLRRLDLSMNSITTVNALSFLTDLEYLYLVDNNITLVAPLGQLTNLVWLELHMNNIVNVTALANLTSLTRLYLQSNSITTGVAELVTLVNATLINLAGNTNIPCADLDALEAALGSGVVTRPTSCQ